MNVDYLVTMANQIADFFVSEAGPDAAPRGDRVAHDEVLGPAHARADHRARKRGGRRAAAGGAGRGADAAAARRKPAQRRADPDRLSAARSVLASSMAIVIGPTPPGTGVIADATCAAGT